MTVGIDLRPVREQRVPARIEEVTDVDERRGWREVEIDRPVRARELRDALGIRTLLAHLHVDVVQRPDAAERESRVVELRRLPGFTGAREPGRITRGVEGGTRDLVDAQVIGVLVERLLVAVRHQHLRTLPPDDGHQPFHRFRERGVGEVVGTCVGVGVGHSRVAVAEEIELGVPDGLDAGPQLGLANRAEIGPDLGGVSGRIEDVALFAAGTAHQRRPDPFGGVPRDRACALRRFVVWVSVHRHETERIAGDVERCGHAREATWRASADTLRHMSRRPLACFVALAITGGFLAGITPASAATTRATTSAGLSSWKSCGRRLQCATLQVPVDAAAPAGDQVGIAVARIRATDPSRRLGSLVMNFGGPGDAGTTTLPSFADQVPAAIRARYDLVSFDPRGVGSSRPVKCISDADADRLNAVDPTPNSDADLASFYDGSHEQIDLVAACVERNGDWLAHVGSREVARDLDHLRALLWATSG